LQFAQSAFQIIGLKTEGAGSALENHLPGRIDQVEAIRPPGVCLFCLIVEAVEQGGKLDSKIANATSRDGRSFFLIFRAGEDDFVFDVASHLPNVTGMRLEDVDGVEGDLVFVLIVELVEGRNLPPEGRSGVAAKNENDGLLAAKRAELDVSGFIERGKREVRRQVAGL
jgi:hypothetical protein